MRRLALAVLTAALATAAAGCGSDGGGRSTSSPAAPLSVVESQRGSVPATPPFTVQPASTPAPSRPVSSTPAPSTPAGSTTARPATAARSTSAAPTRPTQSAGNSAAAQSGVGGSIVVLNPGHNGGNASHPAQINRQVPAGFGAYKACDTTGTNTNAGYPEHAFTFDVALRIRSILQSAGVKVVLTRSDDTGVGPCVDERAADGNGSSVAAVVSIHADGAPASGHGFHVNQDSRRPDGATAAVARASVRLGEAIHGTLVSSSGLAPSNYIGTNGYFYRSDLAGLNLARRPATFLELGNMRNAGDAALLSSAAGRERIARSVASGILAYLRSR
ncbi:MAG: N-acetylmuramoyl-L-alanine amidase [Jatrophihabitans sp.]